MKWLLNVSALLGLMVCVSLAMGEDRGGQKSDSSKKPAAVKKQAGGSGIQTHVERKRVGQPLSDDDTRHVSVLGTHLLHQIDRARQAIDAEETTAAGNALSKAAKVCELIRQMLPKTHVTTTVKNKNGKVLYVDAEDVQPAQIKVYSFLTEIDIASPIVDSKKDAADVKGLQYEGGDVLSADVVVDLGYVERRIHEAERALKEKPADADLALAEAQAIGTSLSVSEVESPLADARRALQYAHQAATRREYEAAQANLRIARGFLTLYRDTAPDDAAKAKELASLDEEIAKVTKEVTGTTAATHAKTTAKTKSFLDRINGWWRGGTDKALRKVNRDKSKGKPRPAVPSDDKK